MCGGGCRERERFGGPYIKTFENPSSILASVICHIILSLSMFFPLLISKTSTLLAFVFFAVFLFFYLVCSIASVLLPVSQPISGFMGS